MTAKTNAPAKRKSSQVTRSAITGRYVKKSTVKRHPKETVTQTVKRRRSQPKP